MKLKVKTLALKNKILHEKKSPIERIDYAEVNASSVNI
jgi:hypothetical protein